MLLWAMLNHAYIEYSINKAYLISTTLWYSPFCGAPYIAFACSRIKALHERKIGSVYHNTKNVTFHKMYIPVILI